MTSVLAREYRAGMRWLLAFFAVAGAILAAGFCTFASENPADAGESVEVTSPNGSERWLVGEIHDITWTAVVSSGLVKIEYSPNGGTSWYVFKSSTPNDGSEPWTVPNIPSAFCLVRISDATDADPSDTSDGPFRVEPRDSWPLITTQTTGEVFVSFLQGQSATEAESEIGFGYAIATTPPQYRQILFQGLPHNPSPTTEQSLGLLPAGSALDFYVLTTLTSSGTVVAEYSGTRPNETFSDLDNDHGWGDTAVTVENVQVESYLLHLDRATGGIDDDNDFLIRVKIVPTGDSPPLAVVQTPSGVQSGNVVISYTLKDVTSDECTISVLLSEDGGWTWRSATMGPGGDGTMNLSSSPTGQSHVFVWDSVADIGLTRQDDIRIRITPSDTEVGTPGETSNFTVDNVPPPVLSCSPEWFRFEAMEGGANPTIQVLSVWNSGGGAMDWRVASGAAWLSLIPTSGQSTGEKDEVNVSAKIAGLPHGIYDTTITVSSVQLPGVTIEVPVRLTLLEMSPVLSVSPALLSFSAWEGGANPATQTLSIQNIGGYDMPWQVSGDMFWLTLSPESGSSSGETDTVEVSVDVSGLTVDSYAAHITVTAPGAIGSPQRIAVLLEVTEPPPLLSVSPATITFTCTEGDNDPAPEWISLRNVGTGEFSWEVSDDAEWLSVVPESGTTSGEADALEVRAEIGGFSPGTYRATITVTATTVNSPQQVEVTLVIKERPPTISVAPLSLTFSAVEGGQNPSTQQLRVKNAGRGEMDWHVAADRSWLSLSPEAGTSAGEEDVIEVFVDIAGLAADSYGGHITITSATAVNSPVDVPVLLEISEPPPLLSVSPAELVFSCTEEGENPSPQEIEIRNAGSGDFSWEVSDDAAWLSLAPTSGSTADETDRVEVSVEIAGLSADTYTATITVVATAANSPQTVSVELVVAEQPPSVLEVTPLRLEFSAVEDEENPPPQEIRITNTGGREMAWQLSSDRPWLSALPESGSSKGEQDVVDVFVDISGLPPGTQWGTLTITAAGALNSPRSVLVEVEIAENPPVLEVTPLNLEFVTEEGAENPAPQTFSIRNLGGRAMDWHLSVEGDWLDAAPASGSNTGDAQAVEVSVASEELAPGMYEGKVTVEAPEAGNSPQSVVVSLEVKAVEPELHVYPEFLDFVTRRGGGNPESKTFTITTRYHKEITWEAEEGADWLSVSPSTDTNYGEEDIVTVSVNKTGLELGRYECEIVMRDVLHPTYTATVNVVLSVDPIRVPEDYPTISAAMDIAEERDVILVGGGTYRERVRMKAYVEVFGEGAERTVIDCGGEGTCVAFEGLEWARLEGFTIQGGTGEHFGRSDKIGGGIYVFQSSPRIAGCHIVDNSAVWGGGICIDGDSAPVFSDCEVCGNSAVMGGGLFFYEDSSATLLATKISDNAAEWFGGGLCLGDDSSVSVRSCELSGNSASRDGGAIHGAWGSEIDVVSCTLVGNSSPEGGSLFAEERTSVNGANSIIWGNSSPMVLLDGGSFQYCDTEEDDLSGKNGNMCSDPLFVGTEEGDYHLLPCSPCIDRGSNRAAGLPAADFDGEARIMEGTLGAVTDIGADEVNPDVPAVLVEDVTPGENGLVALQYKLLHLLQLPCSITVEYSRNGGSVWHNATRFPGEEGTFGLSASPSGEVHVFVWDSVADEGGCQAEGVLLRITPEAAAVGASRVSEPFSLNNADADSDNDRLPDLWEQTIVDANLEDAISSISDVFCEDDFDGDGRSNRAEYLAGTSPVDAQSYLRLLCMRDGNGDAILAWFAVEGKTYRLSCCDGLENGWHVLSETLPESEGWMDFRDETANQTLLRFYRIEVK